jgi:hypothetical protein
MKDLTLSVGPSVLFLLAVAVVASTARGQKAAPASALAGTWTLVAADVLYPDGRRAHDYGESPRGRMLVDAQGRYSIQIYQAERPKFSAGDKRKGTAAEFEAAVLGSSCHYGRIEMDPAKATLTFHIEGAAFPNWEGTQQVRAYELKGDELSYRVPPRPDGGVPISVWRRLR